jgi:acetoin:2,6-dichlorophenolindophenol oxidoreductase subunit beta
MKYRDAIKKSMEMLSQNSNTIFLGYNISFGSKGYGTLIDIPNEKKIETPLAENLMTGLAIGMSMEGYHPILFFERHDFMLIALDGIVNHLDKIESMSQGDFHTPVIIRAVIGSKSPLDPGPQHTQDFTEAFKKLIKFPIYEPNTPKEIIECYEKAKNSNGPVMIIEKRDLYDFDDGN